jgi:hypothetical protein
LKKTALIDSILRTVALFDELDIEISYAANCAARDLNSGQKCEVLVVNHD